MNLTFTSLERMFCAICTVLFFSSLSSHESISLKLHDSVETISQIIIIKNLPQEALSIEIVFQVEGKRMSFTTNKPKGSTLEVPMEVESTKKILMSDIEIISIYIDVFTNPTKLKITSLEIQVKA